MPAVRTHSASYNAKASTSASTIKSKPKRKHHKQRAFEEKESNAAPGMQKVKAALRQTRRLLAKDKLAADVRVETERRLKALEAELQQLEVANKERAFAVRYHKIKFFERQKVTRKIKQTQKLLESTESKKEKKKISAELQELRVDLNYILHYPKMKKYISLFPPEARKGEDVTPASEADSQKSKTEREEVRKWIREQMDQGDLPPEPEVDVGSLGKVRAQKWPTSDSGETESVAPIVGAEKDDFFGDDDE